MNSDHVQAALGAMLAFFLLVMFARLFSPRLEPEEVVIRAPHTIAVTRAHARRQAIEKIADACRYLPVNEANAKDWHRIVYKMKTTYYTQPDGILPLKKLLALTAYQGERRRLLFETIHALYPDSFVEEMEDAVRTEIDPRRFCMAASWLLRHGKYGREVRDALKTTLVQRFPDWRDEPRFEALYATLENPRHEVIDERPPLRDLLEAPFGQRPVIFSFQRLNRNYQGRAVIRQSNGTFLRDTQAGPILTIAQLARAVNDLPGTITNGNTPQGIFEVREFSSSTIRAIGPTATIVLGLPSEYDDTWTLHRYRRLLPQNWHGYWPIYEAWWAGQAGRFEIIAHGTTKDPNHWRQLPFYPNTPSHGCLTALETWDRGNGQRLISEQARLVDALHRAGGVPAWLVVVEVDNQEKPILESEVRRLLP